MCVALFPDLSRNMDRWTRIALLVEQRARSFDYLKQVHQGDMHWLSAVTLGPQDAALSRSVESLQVLRWFYLGVSLGPLLQLPSGPPFVRALLQLFEEARAVHDVLRPRSQPQQLRAHADTDTDGYGHDCLACSM